MLFRSGLLRGGSSFFVKESGAAIGAALYAFGFTYAMLKAINWITPVKVSAAEEETGLDQSQHGEQAYI